MKALTQPRCAFAHRTAGTTAVVGSACAVAGCAGAAIDHADTEMHMFIEAWLESMDEGDCADVQGRLIHICRTGAVGLQSLCDDPQEDAQHHVESRPVTMNKVAQPLWNSQHPLAHRQTREDVIGEVRRRLLHAPGIARGVDTTALAGERHKVIVATIIATGAGKAMRENAALKVFGKHLADKRVWGMVIALPVELPCAGQLKPGFEVLGQGLVQQRALEGGANCRVWVWRLMRQGLLQPRCGR